MCGVWSVFVGGGALEGKGEGRGGGHGGWEEKEEVRKGFPNSPFLPNRYEPRPPEPAGNRLSRRSSRNEQTEPAERPAGRFQTGRTETSRKKDFSRRFVREFCDMYILDRVRWRKTCILGIPIGKRTK